MDPDSENFNDKTDIATVGETEGLNKYIDVAFIHKLSRLLDVYKSTTTEGISETTDGNKHFQVRLKALIDFKLNRQTADGEIEAKANLHLPLNVTRHLIVLVPGWIEKIRTYFYKGK